MIKNKKIICFGAGGSIGSELVRQLVLHNEVFLFDIDETRTYDLYEELVQKGYKVDYRVGDIRNRYTVKETIELFKPNVVINAAAYKHVSPMERYPMEAIETNVRGYFNIIQELPKNCTLLFISSDKAVNASSIMGITKKVGETMTKNAKGIVVRFGNVMQSRGSVMEIWARQHQNKEPLTITDPNMTRYLMTIPEACSLVIQALEKGKKGRTYILDMGEPIKIIQLKNRLYGTEYHVKIIGIRPGEEMEERLMADKERRIAVKKGKLWEIK